MSCTFCINALTVCAFFFSFGLLLAFLNLRLLKNKGELWPESILCEIVSNGASGPYVAAMLDRAYEKSSTKVLLSILSSSSFGISRLKFYKKSIE